MALMRWIKANTQNGQPGGNSRINRKLGFVEESGKYEMAATFE